MTIPHVQITGVSEVHRRRLAETVNKLLLGYHNEVYDVTMSNGAATTRFPTGALLLKRITPDTVPVLVPLTLEAAVLLRHGATTHGAPAPGASATPLFHTSSVGYITFTHASVASALFQFKLLLFGD